MPFCSGPDYDLSATVNVRTVLQFRIEIEIEKEKFLAFELDRDK